MKDPRQIIAAVEAAKGRVIKTAPDGMAFVITHVVDNRDRQLCVIASWGGHWDHASVHATRLSVAGSAMNVTPTWDEMCFVKQLCWQDDEWALEYHPAREDNINVHENTLHIWKPQSKSFPKPPKDSYQKILQLKDERG